MKFLKTYQKNLRGGRGCESRRLLMWVIVARHQMWDDERLQRHQKSLALFLASREELVQPRKLLINIETRARHAVHVHETV